MINNLKHWCGIGIPYLYYRCGDYTYDNILIIPKLNIDEKLDLGYLKKINSPTSCYVVEDPQILSKNNSTYKSFYTDSQGCVTWYEKDDGKICFSFDENKFFLCAENLCEFCNRIIIESNIWYKICNIMHQNNDFNIERVNTTLLKNNLTFFTEIEKEYLKFYFELEQHAKVGIVKNQNGILQFEILDNTNKEIKWDYDRTSTSQLVEIKYYVSDQFDGEFKVIKIIFPNKEIYFVAYLSCGINANFDRC